MRTVINIDVPELSPAIDFYGAALGLKLSRILLPSPTLSAMDSV